MSFDSLQASRQRVLPRDEALFLPLASHGLDRLPWWTNEGQTCFCTLPRKYRILAQLSPIVSISVYASAH